MRLGIRIILVVTLIYVVLTDVKAKLFQKKYLRKIVNVIKTITLPHRGICAHECEIYDGCEGFQETRDEEKFLCQLLEGIQNADCGNISVYAVVYENKVGVCPEGIGKGPRCPGVFRSYNYPDRGISYNIIDEVKLETDVNQFMLMYEGLNKVPGTVSMESMDKLGWYLTNVGGTLQLQERNKYPTSAFNDIATFWLRENLWFNETMSLESFASPEHYIRHSNYMMYVHAFEDKTLFKKDSSYSFVQ